ncbi:MAG TPA: c-type cytochrome domain-containing protein [Luteolibacter sp.]
MTQHDSSSTRHKKPWAITCFGVLAAVGLISMPIVAGAPDAAKMPDIIRFLGHFHPVLLHLPIGVFILILLQEMGVIFGKRFHGKVADTTMFPLFFGAASAILAVIAGFLLYQSGEEFAGNPLAERHLWGGLAFAVAAVTTLVLKAWSVFRLVNPAFYRSLLFASVGMMGFASHDGASLTHGSDYLTEYAPNPVRSVLGIEKKKEKSEKRDSETTSAGVKAIAGQSVVYADIVAPILESRCVQCHKEGKAKGKFRLDTYELLVKGSSDGPGVVPGNLADSQILVRMALPKDDDARMPPKGKPDIEEPELTVVKWWIENGADPKKTLADFQVPPTVKDAIAKLAPAGSAATAHGESVAKGGAPESAAALVPPSEALKAAVAGIAKQYPGALIFESQKSGLLAFSAVSLREKLDDAAFTKLKTVSPQFVSVDLSSTSITDAGVAQLAVSKNLRMIRLAETGVTDASIETLLKMPTLESVNLYGTKVTDAGVAKLSALPKLKRLYLWKTAVTPAAIQTLKMKLPTCEIITGAVGS